MLNIDKIDIACNYSKLQYSEMEKFFDSRKCGEITPKDKFIIIYDISYMLNLLESICKLDNNENFRDKDADFDLIMRMVYGILNSVAHYRHFISSRLKRSSVIILYSSNENHYVRYDETFKKINKILNLFKKTIFIERLDDKTKFIYQHIAYFSAMNISYINNSIKKRCRIMYIGSNLLAMQMLRIDRNMIHIKHNHIECGPAIFFGKMIDDKKHGNLTISYKDIDLIPIFLSLFGFRNGYPKLESIKNRKQSIIYDLITKNCSDSIDKDDYKSIVSGLNLSNKDIDLFGMRLRSLDVDFHNKTYALSKSLLKIWNSKIESKSVYDFNNFFEFDDLTLNVSWLLL